MGDTPGKIRENIAQRAQAYIENQKQRHHGGHSMVRQGTRTGSIPGYGEDDYLFTAEPTYSKSIAASLPDKDAMVGSHFYSRVPADQGRISVSPLPSSGSTSTLGLSTTPPPSSSEGSYLMYEGHQSRPYSGTYRSQYRYQSESPPASPSRSKSVCGETKSKFIYDETKSKSKFI